MQLNCFLLLIKKVRVICWNFCQFHKRCEVYYWF